ncbi:MAG: YbjN domain-containing protein, partial [Actinomycetota bacterium]|nr:YbjN domain-containing protein [Actinomycetota bacterium]
MRPDAAADAGPTRLFQALVARLDEVGIDSFVKLGSGMAPEQLLVALPPDGAGRVLHLQVMFLPDMDPAVLQFFVGLPDRADDEGLDALARFLCAANVVLPVGQFGLVEDQRLVYFRHNVAVADAPLDFDLFGWTVTMAQFVVANIGPLVEAVAGGRLDLPAARRRLADALDPADA